MVEGVKIIDAHTHPRFSTPWDSPEMVKLLNLEPDEIISRCREVGIERMVVLGNILKFGVNPDAKQMRIINEDTAELVRRYPHFFTGYCYLNPLLPREVLEAEANKFIRDGEFVAIKLEVDCCASDPQMGSVMEIAEALGVAVLQHAWDTKNRPILPRPDDGRQETDGEDVAELARRYPRVRIQMAHLTGVGIRGVEAVRDYPNVWVDTSGAQPVSGMTEYAVNVLGEDRVIYGSDYPIRDFRASLGKIYGCGFPERIQEKLFYRNWETMVGLS